MRVLFPLVAFVGAAFAQAAAKMSSTAIPKIKPQPIQPDQLSSSVNGRIHAQMNNGRQGGFAGIIH